MALQTAFDYVLKQMKDIHDKKRHDYSGDANPFKNFEYAAKVAQLPVYKIFIVMIAVKLARLNELLDNKKTPKNESIQDTLIDLANYSALMAAYFKNLAGGQPD